MRVFKILLAIKYIANRPKGGVVMNKYEITFIVRPDMEEAEVTKTADALKEVLVNDKANITTEKAQGQKELAYEIKKVNTGYYFYYEIEANKETIEEFDRVARLNENLLRHLIIRVED